MRFGFFDQLPRADWQSESQRYEDILAQIELGDALGFDTAWLGELHFIPGISCLPSPLMVLSAAAQRTKRIRLGTAVMTLPANDPMRVAENAAFVDILSGGRFILGLGSGYRHYEFDGLGIPFDERHDIQEEAIPIVLDILHKRRIDHQGKYFNYSVAGDYEVFPASLQEPHPPLYMAAGSERSIGFAGRHGFGLMLSTLPAFGKLAEQTAFYRGELTKAPAPWNGNPAFGHIDIARWVYVAETDAKAREESADAVVGHIENFMQKGASGYLGNVSEKDMGAKLDYDELAETTLMHGSPETVIARLRKLQSMTGMTSLVLHYPPYYGPERTLKMLRLFSEAVIPALRDSEPPAELGAAE